MSDTSSLKELLTVAGVSKVIWIDDEFADKSADQLNSGIKRVLAQLFALKVSPACDLLKDITHDLPGEIRDQKIVEVLAETDVMEEILISVEKQLMEVSNGEIPAREDDLSSIQFEWLEKQLPDQLTKCSYEKWAQEKEALVEVSDSDTLFLVDREFTKEGLSKEQGDEIISDLVSRDSFNSYCILLTHTTLQGGEEELRRDIANKEKLKLKAYQFSVVSKKNIGNVDSESTAHLIAAFQVVYILKSCNSLIDDFTSEMKDALDSAKG